MPQYRKKPVVISAEQWFPGRDVAGVYEHHDHEGGLGCEWRVDTLEGPLRVIDGDFIITGVKGERYPCKPDVFALTYEEVES